MKIEKFVNAVWLFALMGLPSLEGRTISPDAGNYGREAPPLHAGEAHERRRQFAPDARWNGFKRAKRSSRKPRPVERP